MFWRWRTFWERGKFVVFPCTLLFVPIFRTGEADDWVHLVAGFLAAGAAWGRAEPKHVSANVLAEMFRMFLPRGRVVLAM